jgi:hypothetical protein
MIGVNFVILTAFFPSRIGPFLDWTIDLFVVIVSHLDFRGEYTAKVQCILSHHGINVCM